MDRGLLLKQDNEPYTEPCPICERDCNVKESCFFKTGSNSNLDINPELSTVILNCNYRHSQWRRNYFFDSRYHTFNIPKRSGGVRTIKAPSSSLKYQQRIILESLERSAVLHECCHGFRKDHSIKTNALPHVGCEMVINFDIKDFFPSISRSRVKSMFMSLCHNEHDAYFLTSMTTCNGHLPQGAPTSPMIANIICFKMDCELSELAEKYNANYTRYADDLTFSGNQGILQLLPTIRKIVKNEGFKLNPSKFRIQRKGNRQEVTGLAVNDKASIPRSIRRKLRAALHRVTNGITPHWNHQVMDEEVMQGHIDFVTSIHPELKNYYKHPCDVYGICNHSIRKIQGFDEITGIFCNKKTRWVTINYLASHAP